MTVAMRHALKIAYDGTKFSGSQRQPKARTVDGECIFVLKKIGAIEGPDESRYRSASRTDAGVSAIGNVIAFDTDMGRQALMGAFNSDVKDVWAWANAVVPDGFNPRNAVQQWYRYYMPESTDIRRARAASRLFEGTHDFKSFTRDKGNTVRMIESVRLSDDGGYPCFDIKGQSFLWGLVRRIVSCVTSYASGEVSLDEIKKGLAGEKRDFGLAPPEPLFLMDVDDGIPFEFIFLKKIRTEIESNLERSRLDFARWALFADKILREKSQSL